MKRLVPLLLAVLTLTSAYLVPEETPGNPSAHILQEAVDEVPKAEEPIILPPISSKQGPELALLIVPGAYINAAAYQPLGEAIQAASPMRLWVGLVRPFALDLPNPAQCDDDIELTLQMMIDQGMNTSTKAVVGGHSLGGVVMQEWIFSNLPVMSGMILMASDLGRDLSSVPFPVMHITGDLDGMVRVPEVEPVFRELEELVFADPSSMVTKPVVILEDLNHMLFASGDPPPAVQENDILSPVSEEDGHALYAIHMSAFITAAIGEPQDQLDEARAILEKDFIDTKEIIRPLLEMRDLTAGESSSPWASVAQLIISNLDPSFSGSVVVNDTLFRGLEEFESYQPVIESVGDTAVVNTYSMVTYPGTVGLEHMVSAEELAIKLKRQEAVAEILSPIGVTFSNGSATCKDINEAAIAAAVSSASAHVTQRYYSRGRQLVLLEDDPKQSGPQWLDSSVQYNGTEDNVFVQSSSLITALGVPFGFDGMNYCKLMPPSRALEYIMLDSLRGTEPILFTKEVSTSSQRSSRLDSTLTNKRLNTDKQPSEKNLVIKAIHRQKPNEVVPLLVQPVIKSKSEQKIYFVQPQYSKDLPDISSKNVQLGDGGWVQGNDLPRSLQETKIHDNDIDESVIFAKTHDNKLLKAFKGLESIILRRERLEGFEALVSGDEGVKPGDGEWVHEANKNKDQKAENQAEETTHSKYWFLDVKNGLGDMLKDTNFLKRPKFVGKAERRISEHMAGTLTSDDEIKEALTSGFKLLFPRGIVSHIVGKLAEKTEHYTKPLFAMVTSYWKGVGNVEEPAQDHHFKHEKSKASMHYEQQSDHMDVDEKHHELRSDHKPVGEKHREQRSDHIDVDLKHDEHRSDHKDVEKHHEHRSDHKPVHKKRHEQRSDHMDVDEQHHEHRSEHTGVNENHHEHHSDHMNVNEKHHDHHERSM